MWTLRVWSRSAFKKIRPLNDNRRGQREAISLFDVKELYDSAYGEKAKARGNLKEFTRLLARAGELEQAYREQEAMAEINEFRARAHKIAMKRAGAARGAATK